MTRHDSETAPAAGPLPRVLGVIPARGGSKGIPHKNILPLAGLPLVAYTIRAAQASRLLTECIVSTDDPRIAEVCRAHGASVPFLRPAELATDVARSQDVALHALDHVTPAAPFDYVMLLQPTTPLRAADDIDGAIRLAARYGARSVISFTELETHHPYYMYFVEPAPGGDGRPAMRQVCRYDLGLPRQSFPRAAYRNGAIYLVSVAHLRAQRSFAAEDTVPYFMPEGRSVNIDCRDDIDWAEFLLARKGR